jgi:hypothetical protein
LGFLALAQNDPAQAKQLFSEGLRTALAQGNLVGCALALNGQAGVALAQRRWEQAVSLLSALQTPFSDPEERWDTDDYAVYQRQIAEAQTLIPAPEFSRLWEAGQGLNIVDLAMSILGKD